MKWLGGWFRLTLTRREGRRFFRKNYGTACSAKFRTFAPLLNDECHNDDLAFVPIDRDEGG